MTVIAIIPARGGSKRLPRKNIVPVFGRPMIEWSINACLESAIVDEVFVSTEDEEIGSVSEKAGATIIPRPASLADDEVPKMEVIRHADQWYQQQYGEEAEILLSIQANSPELRVADIEKGLQLLRENGLWEVISLNQEGIQNAALRVIHRKCLYNTFLSANIGAVINDYIDVHTQEDVDHLHRKYADQDAFISLNSTG